MQINYIFIINYFKSILILIITLIITSQELKYFGRINVLTHLIFSDKSDNLIHAFVRRNN